MINVDKLSYSANSYNVKNFKKNRNYLFYKTDINKTSKILQILNKHKPIGIFNLAAETHVDRSIDKAHHFIRSNIVGVYSLLEAIRKFENNKVKKIKLLQISTDEVYGDIPNNKKADENHNYNPSSPYSASKAAADQFIKSYSRTYGLKIMIAHPCNNYGPNQHPEKFIPKMIFNILNNKPLPVYGNGKNVREWIYVKDNCEALLKIFLKGKNNQNYNIGTGIRLKNTEIAKKLLDIAKKRDADKSNKSKIVFVKDRPGHDERYALNSKLIKKEIKWKNKISLSNGLLKTLAWYSKNYNYFKQISKKNITKRLGLKL